MTTVFQIIFVLSITWITINGRHLRKDKELEKYKEHEKIHEKEGKVHHVKHKRESNEIAGEKPPAPVLEIIQGEKANTDPFLPPSPERVKIPLESNKVTRSMNTEVLTVIEKDTFLPPIYGELPSKETILTQELLITPKPAASQQPPVPVPAPIYPELPKPVPITVPVQQPVSAPPLSPLPPYFSGVTKLMTQVSTPVAPPPAPVPIPAAVAPVPPPVAPVPAPVPVAPIPAPVPVAPVPPPPPVAPAPPPPPVAPPPPPPPVQEAPMKPSRYAVYLGDMFLKLMTQLLNRARLTLSRLTGPPPVTPDATNTAS